MLNFNRFGQEWVVFRLSKIAGVGHSIDHIRLDVCLPPWRQVTTIPFLCTPDYIPWVQGGICWRNVRPANKKKSLLHCHGNGMTKMIQVEETHHPITAYPTMIYQFLGG